MAIRDMSRIIETCLNGCFFGLPVVMTCIDGVGGSPFVTMCTNDFSGNYLASGRLLE